MIYPVVAELDAKGLPIAVACRLLGVSTSGYYSWRSARTGPPSARRQADEALGTQIRLIHQSSRGTYGSPRVHAELRLAAGVRCGRKRVARLMRQEGLEGVYRRRRKGCTVRDPAAAPAADLVNRRFTADRPDALWLTDITQHRTSQGWVYCAVVMDVFARRVVGWSIADHERCSAGRPRPRHSRNIYNPYNKPVVRRPIESRLRPAIAVEHDTSHVATGGHRVTQRRDDQVSTHVIGQRIADQAA